MLTQGKLITSDGDLNRISKRSYLADINLAAFCDSHVSKGNRVGQRYGLEAIGFFHDQVEINNSPVQTFSTVRPGDIKYKDQNGDNRIDEQDVVKMFGSSVPRFYFGVNLTASYKNFEISADFQGMTDVTTSLLNSPLYQPLVSS